MQRKKSAWQFPVYYFLDVIGMGLPEKLHESNMDSNARAAFSKAILFIRQSTFWLYVGASLVWFLFFSICVFSYEVTMFRKGKEAGTEKESNIIIRMLDNVPWTACMLRNVIVISHFVVRRKKFRQLHCHMTQLFDVFFEFRKSPVHRLVRSSLKRLLIAWFVVLINFLMNIMYYFNIDFSDLRSRWNFSPLPFVLSGWQVMLSLIVFTLIPFLVSQIVVISVVALAEGALCSLEELNVELKKLGTGLDDDENFVSEQKFVDFTKSVTLLRAAHFEVVHFVHEISEAYSLMFLTAVAADFAAAVGFMGLLIGRPSTLGVNRDFTRVYHALATITWMGFHLCIQYWPMIKLPEKAEGTYHLVQSLSFVSSGVSVTSVQFKRYERELLHFLNATRNSECGIVAGKLLHFSRHLSVTMITLLCSYGVLVYEILHRDRSLSGEAGHRLLTSSNASVVAQIFEQKLDDTIYGNMSVGPSHF